MKRVDSKGEDGGLKKIYYIINEIIFRKENDTYYANNGEFETRMNSDDENGEETTFFIQFFTNTLVKKYFPYGWRLNFYA